MKTVVKIMAIILTACCCLRQQPVLAQSGNKEKLAAILKKIEAKYDPASRLSFRVKYRYYSDNDGQVTDSLEGEIKTFGNSYACMIDSTETIKKDSIILSLFKEDRLIHVTKSRLATTMWSPAMATDSLLKALDRLDAEISHPAGATVILFRPGAGRQMELTLEGQDGYVSAVRYWLPKTGNSNNAGGQNIVEARFYDYQAGSFDDTVFDLSRYIIKTSNGYKVTDAYSAYSLFMGTPNL